MTTGASDVQPVNSGCASDSASDSAIWQRQLSRAWSRKPEEKEWQEIYIIKIIKKSETG